MPPGPDASTASPAAPARAAEIAAVCEHLTRFYVFPDVAEQVAGVLRRRLADDAYGAFVGADTDEAFAAAVTTDLQSINGDLHLRLQFVPGGIPDDDEDAFDLDEYRAEVELSAAGVAAVRRLDGNVGYLDVRELPGAPFAGAHVVAAMTLVAHTDALIIDLRRNTGGDPNTVALWCSYLFDEPTHLNDIYLRPGDRTLHSWSHAWVPGPRFGGSKPVYVLISGETFSGGEELAYDLKTRERATLIGERTRGGAHPGSRHRVGPHLRSTIPMGRAINPVTGTNWEAVGVEPDVELAAADAYDEACRRALDHVLTLGSAGPRRDTHAQAVTARSALDG